MAAAPRVENDAAAAFAVRVDQVADRRLDTGLAQRFDDETALPGAVGRACPMLQGAAAANAEMRADRRDAVSARHLDAEQMAPVGLTGHGLNLDGLARQRAGNVNWTTAAVRHAIAAMAEPIDDHALNHVRPR